MLPTSEPVTNGVPYLGAAAADGVGRLDLGRATQLTAAATRMARAADVTSLWPIAVAEALSLIAADGAAVLAGRGTSWRVTVRSGRDTPTTDRLDTSLLDITLLDTTLLDAAARGLVDNSGVVADAIDRAGAGPWRSLLVCAVAGPSQTERLRLVWYSADPTAFSTDLDLAHLLAEHVGIALVGVTECVTLRQAIAARHRIGQAQGIVMALGGQTVEESFEFLRRISQQHNVKLRDLADQIIDTRSLPAQQSRHLRS